MTKATPLKRFWGTFLGWIIWSGRPTLNPSEVRRPTLNGPHLLVAGHIKALEEWSSCFLCAGPHFHWQAHLPWPLPSLLSEPTSPRFQSGLKSDRSLGPPLDSSTRLGLRDSQSHALTDLPNQKQPRLVYWVYTEVYLLILSAPFPRNPNHHKTKP